MSLGEGHVLGGRYRLLSHIGRGGMGTVWHAHDEILDRDVAVKEVLFPPGLSDDEHQVMYERTLREARSAARLSHPGIVTVHDVVEEDGRPCIVMEYVRACSLQDVIDEEGRLPPIEVAEIGRQVLAALGTAHAAGITHRDVKPANVLLAGRAGEPISRATRVVITDFGIATMEGDSTLTRTGLIMGSPAYIAPERARGDRFSPASDLWSLGATLYAAVEGRSPHHRPEAMAALTSVISEEAPPPRYAGPLTPVLMGLLVKDPALRLTADQAREGLSRVIHSTRPLPVPDVAAMTSDGAYPRTGRLATLGRDTAEPAPPARPSPPVADPGAGGPVYGPVTVHDPAPYGVGRPGPAGPSTPGTGGPPNTIGSAQDESWMLAYDRPADASSPAGKRGRGTKAVTALVAALVAVLAVTGLTLTLLFYYSGRNANLPSAVASPPSVSPSKTSATPGTGIPAGYHLVTAMDGSKLAVPKGWRHEVRGNQSERWIDPTAGSNVQLDTIPWGTDDPVRHWQTWEGPKVLPGFQMIEPPHPVEARGWRMGDVHYTWIFPWNGDAQSGEGVQHRERMHVFDRSLAVGGRQYSLMAVGEDPAVAKDYFDEAFAAFQPGSH